MPSLELDSTTSMVSNLDPLIFTNNTDNLVLLIKKLIVTPQILFILLYINNRKNRKRYITALQGLGVWSVWYQVVAIQKQEEGKSLGQEDREELSRPGG